MIHLVNYVLSQRDRPSVVTKAIGKTRPALVVNDRGDGLANLIVFSDGPNDSTNPTGVMWAEARRYSENKEEGTWHK